MIMGEGSKGIFLQPKVLDEGTDIWTDIWEQEIDQKEVSP
jgi:hypothetical protein